MSDFSTTWQELLAKLRSKTNENNYNRWISQIKFISAGDHAVKLGVPNVFVKDWISDYYNDLIIQELYTITHRAYSIEYNITGDALPAEELVQMVPSGGGQEKPAERPHQLNPRYSFERFVVGSSNQFAHAACLSAAELPGGRYNPLFIYGGVGLGKTHLLNAVGTKILEKFPNIHISYLSAEQFMNELIHCIRFEKMDQFRKKFREECDVFLVDDVPFINGKERTVEEFFHTFNALYDAQKQIVLTSDRLPKELHGMEDRLKSRFEWGLIADIQPPDLETRIAILKKKADLNSIELPDDVAFFLASQIRSNIRELEGSLIRLSAFASMDGIKITTELAHNVLKNILKEKTATCSMEAIQRAVAEFYKINISDLKSPRRLKSIAMPRQVAMYLCKKHLKASYPEIGLKFGGKDHSTVIHAVKKVSGLLEKSDALKSEIETIEKVIIQ